MLGDIDILDHVLSPPFAIMTCIKAQHTSRLFEIVIRSLPENVFPVRRIATICMTGCNLMCVRKFARTAAVVSL